MKSLFGIYTSICPIIGHIIYYILALLGRWNFKTHSTNLPHSTSDIRKYNVKPTCIFLQSHCSGLNLHIFLEQSYCPTQVQIHQTSLFTRQSREPKTNKPTQTTMPSKNTLCPKCATKLKSTLNYTSVYCPLHFLVSN